MSLTGYETGKQTRSGHLVRIPKGQKRPDECQSDAPVQWLDLRSQARSTSPGVVELRGCPGRREPKAKPGAKRSHPMRGSASPQGEARRQAPPRQSEANAAAGRTTGGGGRVV